MKITSLILTAFVALSAQLTLADSSGNAVTAKQIKSYQQAAEGSMSIKNNCNNC